MKNVVVDASMTLPLGILSEYSDDAELLLEESLMARVRLLVPPHWRLEMLNGIIQGVKAHRLYAGSVSGALEAMDLIDPEELLPADDADIVRLAQEESLTAYDAAYLAVAIREHAELATADGALGRAAKKHKLYWEPPNRKPFQIQA